MDVTDITTAFQQTRGTWTGCNWATRFGSRALNLRGLKSSQARLMARSTAGQEAAEWKAATGWLEQVERDAREAELQAGLAADLVARGQLEAALEHAQQACGLESKYKYGGLVWQPLRNAIATEMEESSSVRARSAETDLHAASLPACR